MSPASLFPLVLLLIIKQAISLPADQAVNKPSGQSVIHTSSTYGGGVAYNLAAREAEQQIEELDSSDALEEGFQPLSLSLLSKMHESSSQIQTEESSPASIAVGSYKTTAPSEWLVRGLLSDLLSTISTKGSETPNIPGEESIKARLGQQTATVISSSTYTEGTKPATKPKPTTKPKPATGQGKPTAAPNLGISTGPSSSFRPPSLSQTVGLLSSLFSSGASGSQKPAKPPKPGPDSSQFGSILGNHVFPGSMFGYPSPVFGSSNSGSNGQRPSHGNSFTLPPWVISWLRSTEESSA